MRLADKIAIITGAASGIGQATALAFAREGATVGLADIADCSSTLRLIVDAGGRGLARQVDVGDPAQVASFVDSVVEAWGALDIVFNNAGMGLNRSLTDATDAEFDRIFDVNVKGVFNGCKFALPHLLTRGGGAIINMASSAGLVARADDPLYVASKHAVVGLTRSISLAYAAVNVRANAICPGPIDTPMFWAGQGDRSREAHLARVLASCPAARLAPASDVANTAVFLASDESRFLTGAAIPIDGAKTAGTMSADRYRLPVDLI